MMQEHRYKNGTAWHSFLLSDFILWKVDLHLVSLLRCDCPWQRERQWPMQASAGIFSSKLCFIQSPRSADLCLLVTSASGSLFVFLSKNYFICWKGRVVRRGHGKKQGEFFYPLVLLPKWLQQLGLSLAEAKSQELHTSLPHGCRPQTFRSSSSNLSSTLTESWFGSRTAART